MPPNDQFDTIIQDVRAGYGREATPARQPYPVVRFAAGLDLFLLAGILLYVLAWLLRHG